MRYATLFLVLISATASGDEPIPRIGEKLPRRGDEIVVCGQLYHTTTPVVLWTDPQGYDAYRVERRFAPLDRANWKITQATVPAFKDRNPNRYTMRMKGLSNDEIEHVRGGGWDLPILAKQVDQFVIHFDARGTSKRCFQILHDVRGLSVHFMLDIDGTIYQTLDLKEAAQHATIANGRSIGIEVANIGAYPLDAWDNLKRWYQQDADGRVRIVDPDLPRDSNPISTRGVPRPLRPEPIVGTVQGQELRQYDYTLEQYNALAKLAATLCTLFPKIRCDYPRDGSGALIRRKIDGPDLSRYQGFLGHYHVQTNKVDPGPAFQWDRFIDQTRTLIPR